MATLPTPLQPIPDGAVDLSFDPPQYSNIFAQTVGNAATETDGWDAIFQDASQILTTWGDFLASLDLPLASLDSVFPDVQAAWEQDFSDSLAGAISNGQADFARYNVALTNSTPPPPGAAPSGSTGGTTPTPGTCPGTLTFAAANSQPVTESVFFQNQNSVAITILSKTLEDPTPGTFTVTDTIPATMAASAQARITATQNKAGPKGYKATYTIVTTGADSPVVLCLVLGDTNSGLSGTSGTAGGPTVGGRPFPE